MKLSLALLSLAILLFAACEKTPEAPPPPTPEEQAARATPTPKPTPPPGSWMWDKNRGNPLEQKPKR